MKPIVSPKQETPDMIRYDRTISYHLWLCDLFSPCFWFFFSNLLVQHYWRSMSPWKSCHRIASPVSPGKSTVSKWGFMQWPAWCMMEAWCWIVSIVSRSILGRDKQKELDDPYPFYVWTLCCNHKTRSALQPQDLFEDNGQVDCTNLWDQNTWQQASDP